MKRMTTWLLAGGLAAAALGSEVRVELRDLPPAVRKTVREQSRGARLRGVSKEVDHGKTYYEAETVVEGRSRDVLIDPQGTIVEVEEQVPLASVPPAARAALRKRAEGGTIHKVEVLRKDGSISYEAAVSRGGKRFEVAVAEDGSPRN